MSAISLKSITGITSITTPAGIDNQLTLHTNNTTERFRIDSSGRLLIGTTTEGHGNADDLTIVTTDHTGITLRSATNRNGSVFFSDGTSGADEYRGWIQYTHTSDYLTFGTAANEGLRITSTGDLSLRSTTQNAFLGLTANSTAINFTLGSTSGTSPRVYMYGTGNGQSSAGDIFMGAGTGGILHFRSAESIKFEVNSDNSTAEALRIEADRDIGLLTSTPNLSGYGAPTTSIGKSSNPYSVLELQGNQTSDGAMGVIVGYNSAGSSRIATINLARQGGNNYGAISFDTADNGTLVERARITNSGLTFNGDTAAANALDDYEEGTWTPSLSGFTNGGTNDNATYVKIGQIVQIGLNIYQSSNNMSWVSGASIAGLPFAPAHLQGVFIGGYNNKDTEGAYLVSDGSGYRIILMSGLSGVRHLWTTFVYRTTQSGT